jgi:hypothetical protein
VHAEIAGHAILYETGQYSFLSMMRGLCDTGVSFSKPTETVMKAYQWLTLSAALVLTVFEGVLFTSATGIVSHVETRAPAAVAEAYSPTKSRDAP